jgi:hypothetical protein
MTRTPKRFTYGAHSRSKNNPQDDLTFRAESRGSLGGWQSTLETCSIPRDVPPVDKFSSDFVQPGTSVGKKSSNEACGQKWGRARDLVHNS